jgi:hypothetical protein
MYIVQPSTFHRRQPRCKVGSARTTLCAGLFIGFALALVGCGGSSSSTPAAPPAGAPPPASPPPVTGGAGLSIKVQGDHMIDASGKTVQLRGVNFSAYEAVAVLGWSPADPTGAQGGQPNGPKWSAIASWKANVVRIPLNEASWLGYTCTDSMGVAHNPDPGGNYKASLATNIAAANAAGLYVSLVLHWAAPGTACPMLQTQMADADNSIRFWTSIANAYKGNPSVMFALYNEPFFDFDFTGDAWQYMMTGTGGSFSGYPATDSLGNWKDVKQPWAVASFQQMIDAVRATGSTNIVLIGTMAYSGDFSGWLAHPLVDSAGQLAASWHAYPTFGAPWGSPTYAQPNFAPGVFQDVKNIVAAGTPVTITETGDQNSAGTVGAPFVSTMTQFADQNGLGVIAWTWDVWDLPNNVLIKDVNGTPTDGYGEFYKNWMVTHAP